MTYQLPSQAAARIIASSDAQFAEYADCDNIFLFVDDVPGVLEQNIQTAIRELRGGKLTNVPGDRTPNYLNLVTLCQARSVQEASDHLGKFKALSPGALLFASLDYNLELGATADNEGRPTGGPIVEGSTVEGLFRDENFTHYANNGGAVVMYTGEPQRVITSRAVQALTEYERLAIFVATKSEVDPQVLYKMFRPVLGDPFKITPLKKFSENCGLDLTKNIKAADRRRKIKAKKTS